MTIYISVPYCSCKGSLQNRNIQVNCEGEQKIDKCKEGTIEMSLCLHSDGIIKLHLFSNYKCAKIRLFSKTELVVKSSQQHSVSLCLPKRGWVFVQLLMVAVESTSRMLLLWDFGIWRQEGTKPVDFLALGSLQKRSQSRVKASEEWLLTTFLRLNSLNKTSN